MSRRGSVRFVRPRHPLFRGSQPVKWTSVPCGIGGCGRTPSSGFSERPTRSSRHPANISPTRRRSRTSRRVRALAGSARCVLEDALAILGPQEVALQFEGLVVRRSAGRSRSIGIRSRLPEKRVKPHCGFVGRDAGTGPLGFGASQARRAAYSTQILRYSYYNPHRADPGHLLAIRAPPSSAQLIRVNLVSARNLPYLTFSGTLGVATRFLTSTVIGHCRFFASPLPSQGSEYTSFVLPNYSTTGVHFVCFGNMEADIEFASRTTDTV